MKKKLVSVILVAAMAATMASGCGNSASSETADSATVSTEATAEGGSAASGEGSVYFLNFKPETDEIWQNLASDYTDETGVDVTVLTAADGQYLTILQSEMAKSQAPTIFNIGNPTAAQTWDDYAMDLKDTNLYDHLTDKSLTVEYNGKTSAIAYCYECYGLIYNKTILDDYCSMDNAVVSSADEINNVDTLKAVADDIQARVDEINDEFGTDLTGAFTSAGLDDGSSWRYSGHLANLPLYYEFKDDGCNLISGEAEIDGTYLDQYKNLWDMYVADSAADPKTLNSGTYNAEEEFGMGEAVFFQNGDWEYSSLTDENNGYLVTEDDLGMMPIYFGVDDENQGLCVGTENNWAINGTCDQADIDASLAFLDWVISSDEGRDAITNKMGLTAPYDTFTDDYETKNPFFKDCNEMMESGKQSVAWSFGATPNVDNWRADVVAALTAYTDGSGDWDSVKTAFVDGWANQWQLAAEANAAD